MLSGLLTFHGVAVLAAGLLGADDGYTPTFDVSLNVRARATVESLDLFLYSQDNSNTAYRNILRLFDGNALLPADAGVYSGTKDLNYSVDNSRRLIINLAANSYKSNVQNKVFGESVAAIVHYVLTRGVTVNVGDDEVDYSGYSHKEYKAPNVDCTYTFNMGVLVKLSLTSPFIDISLDTCDAASDDITFQTLREKDKFGNVLSREPIKTVGYSFSTALPPSILESSEYKRLNSSTLDESSPYATLNMGLYATLADVIATHPEKDLSYLKYKHNIIVTDETLEDVMKYFWSQDKMAYDTETTGLDINFKSRTGEADVLVGVILSCSSDVGYYFPLRNKKVKNLCNGDVAYFMERYMKSLLEKKYIICHNGEYDWKVSYIYGINVNIQFDTRLAFDVTKGYEVEDFSSKLKLLSKTILGIDQLDLSDFVDGKWGDSGVKFWDLPYDFVKAYGPADGYCTWALYEYVLKSRLLERYTATKVFNLEVQFSKVVAYSEFYGLHIDTDRIEDLKLSIEKDMAMNKAKLVEIAGHDLNPESPKQLSAVMYDELGLSNYENSRSTKGEMLKSMLEGMAEDKSNKQYIFLKTLQNYRESAAIKRTFLKRLDADECAKSKKKVVSTSDGFIFSSVYQCGTNTGRVSIKDPNYQSYNDIVKEYITPRIGFTTFDCDFSQIEYRVLCSLAHEYNLIKAFEDPDLDYHRYQASRIFSVPYAAVTGKLRSYAKGINFGLPYGMGDRSLGKRVYGKISAENTRKAAALRTRYFVGQENILNFFETVRDTGVRNLYTETWLGRRRYYFAGKFSTKQIRRQAGNHVIQGTAADIYKLAVVRVFKRICKEGLLGKVLIDAFVHDEIVVEISDEVDKMWWLKAWREEYQLSIDGFCKIYAGAGFGRCWKDAKHTELSPHYIDYLIDKYGDCEDNPTRHMSQAEFITWLYDNQDKFDQNRLVEYFKAPENQGEIIVPAFSVLLKEQIIVMVSGMTVEERSALSISVGYKKDEMTDLSDKKILGDIQKNITLFCHLKHIDRGSVNILSPDDVTATTFDDSKAQAPATQSKSKSSVNDKDDSCGMTYGEAIYASLSYSGCAIDTDRRIMYIDNYDIDFSGKLLTDNCIGLPSANSGIEEGYYQIYMHDNPLSDTKETALYYQLPFEVKATKAQGLKSTLYLYRELHGIGCYSVKAN